ncbi:MAG: DUF523 domain-containing protein [Porticoccaceae bacterium]
MSDRIPVGISSCLLGNTVRYDGGHCRDPYINEILTEYFDFHPFCPEVAIGLGVPRPPIRLVASSSGLRVLGVDDPGLDVGAPLQRYAQEQLTSVRRLHGFIFKKNSPSCGMAVNVHDPAGTLVRQAPGVFAAAVMQAFPQLPTVEEGHLADPVVRERFIECVLTHRHWHTAVASRLSMAGLRDFHHHLEATLMRRDPVRARELAALVAGLCGDDLAQAAAAYFAQAMALLRKTGLERMSRGANTFKSC